MPQSARHCYVDISKFPADEKEHIFDMAKQHNSLVTSVSNGNEIIFGTSDVDISQTKTAFAVFHKVGAWLHSKRFNVFFLALTVKIGLDILKSFGVDLTEFGPHIIQILGGVYGS